MSPEYLDEYEKLGQTWTSALLGVTSTLVNLTRRKRQKGTVLKGITVAVGS